jgi:hypothetical protein
MDSAAFQKHKALHRPAVSPESALRSSQRFAFPLSMTQRRKKKLFALTMDTKREDLSPFTLHSHLQTRAELKIHK